MRGWLKRHGAFALLGVIVLSLMALGHLVWAGPAQSLFDIFRFYVSVAVMVVLVGSLLWRETTIGRERDRAQLAEQKAAEALRNAEKAIESTRESLTRIGDAERRADAVARSMREAIEALSDGFAMFDAQDRLVLCNSVFHDLYPLAHPIEPGVRFEDMMRRAAHAGQFADCDPTDPEAWIAERMRLHREPGGAVEIRLNDGRWMRVLERRTSDGGYVGTRADVTELKRRAMELAESEERFRRLSEAALDGVIIHDQGIIQDASLAAGHIFGYRPQDIIGHHLEEFLMPEHKGIVEERQAQRAEGRETVRAKRRDGQMVLLEAENRYVSHGGRIKSMICFRDVTEWRDAEVQLRAAKDEAERANRAKSEVVRMISHEIRTPLNGLLGMLDLVIDGTLSPEQRTYATTARTSGQALVDIIGDLLDTAKMEAGRLTLEPQEFDPAELTESVADLLAPRAREKNLALAAAVDPGVPARVVADAGRVRQILVNLAGNAVKFTETGGVAIALRLERANDGSPVLRFTVSDSGIGIAASARPRLFQEFGQADPDTSRLYGGFGLGLAISRRFVDLMGGEIDFESEPGHGSRFWFTVPVRIEDVAPPVLPRPPAGTRLLLVEPCAVTREALTGLLAACGFEVISRPALPRAGEVKATLALIDAGSTMAPLADTLLSLGIERAALMLSAGEPEPEGLVAMTKPVHRDQLLTLADGTGVAPPEPAGEPPAEAAPPRRGRILVVEDSRTNQMVACAFLRAAGYLADAVSNGVEALSILSERPYDLVLMDIAMPGMDGLEATRALRALPPPTGTLPVIAMTADAAECDRERSLAAGMNDHVTKPVDRATLLDTIDRWLPVEDEEDGALDTGVLAQLGADLDPETMAEIVAECLRESEARASRIADPTTDLATVMTEAHTLKSTAGTFGMKTLSSVARELEAAARAGNRSIADRLRPRLPSLVRAAAASLRQHGYIG